MKWLQHIQHLQIKVYTINQLLVTSIEDKNGTILYQFTPETKDVLSAETAYVTTKLLEGVTEAGSGMRLKTYFCKGSTSL